MPSAIQKKILRKLKRNENKKAHWNHSILLSLFFIIIIINSANHRTVFVFWRRHFFFCFGQSETFFSPFLLIYFWKTNITYNEQSKHNRNISYFFPSLFFWQVDVYDYDHQVCRVYIDFCFLTDQREIRQS